MAVARPAALAAARCGVLAAAAVPLSGVVARFAVVVAARCGAVAAVRFGVAVLEGAAVVGAARSAAVTVVAAALSSELSTMVACPDAA